MRCREFSEISEAYLSDELLVETNIQVFQHLEECSKCRERFAAARLLRQRLSASIRNSKIFQIDPVFANRLAAQLRESTRKPILPQLIQPRISIPILALVLIAGLLGFALMNPSDSNLSPLPSAQPIVESVAHILEEVVGHHQTCAIAKLKIWEQRAKADERDKATYTDTILKPLRNNFSNRMEILHSDDCLFEGKPFVHVILKDGENVVSVFLAKPDAASSDTAHVADSIQANEHDGFRIAAFRTESQQIFVVSDLPENENRTIALTLLNAWI